MLKKEYKVLLCDHRMTREQRTHFKKCMLSAQKVWENRKYIKEKNYDKSSNTGNQSSN